MVIVEDFFSVEGFLNLAFPEFVMPMGQGQGEAGGHAKSENVV